MTHPTSHHPHREPLDDPAALRRMLADDAYTAAELARAVDQARDAYRLGLDRDTALMALIAAADWAVANLSGVDPVRRDAVALSGLESHRRTA